jgi:hypothetical protein
VLLIALVVLLLTFGLGTAAEDATAPSTLAARPALTIQSMNPVRVVGRGFKAGEHVVVSVGPRRRAATADARGRFIVTFARARCTSGTIVAIGSRGSRAKVNVPHTLCFEP